MVFDHDYEKYPELSNSQIAEMGLFSPHPQITEDFVAQVEKVIDGDTIKVSCSFRDFVFPVRLLDIDAPEMSELGGDQAQEFLKQRIEGQEVLVLVDKRQRVCKYGRLLGRVLAQGVDVGQELLNFGLAYSFGHKKEGEPFNIDKLLRMNQWF